MYYVRNRNLTRLTIRFPRSLGPPPLPFAQPATLSRQPEVHAAGSRPSSHTPPRRADSPGSSGSRGARHTHPIRPPHRLSGSPGTNMSGRENTLGRTNGLDKICSRIRTDREPRGGVMHTEHLSGPLGGLQSDGNVPARNNGRGAQRLKPPKRSFTTTTPKPTYVSTNVDEQGSVRVRVVHQVAPAHLDQWI